MFKAALLICALALTGCTSQTHYGDCIGLGEDKDPTLVYDLSAKNLVLGIVFVEAIVVPAVVAFDELYCPVRRKTP